MQIELVSRDWIFNPKIELLCRDQIFWNQAKAKQHSEAKLLLIENYSISSSTLSSKNNSRYSKTSIKSKYVCLNEVIMITDKENEAENEKQIT